MIIIPKTQKKRSALIEAILNDSEMMYALKHRMKGDNGINLCGMVTCDHFRGGNLIHTQKGRNTFTTEGMAYLLNIIFHDISKAASNIWYVGIFDTNVTPALANTAAVCLGSGGSYGELQDPAEFDEADDGTTTASTGDKPGYTTVDTTTATITNTAAQAHFVLSASRTIYGAFLSSVASCSDNTGAKLMCAKAFGTARSVVDNDEINITYEITASTS